MDGLRQQKDERVETKVLAWLEWLKEMGVDRIKKKVVTMRSDSPVLTKGDEITKREHNVLAPFAAARGRLTLPMVRDALGECTRCKLSAGRKNIVFGEGNSKAELMFVGEAPGADEDLQGQPFVGRAGQLLTKMIIAMGLSREEVYIANIVKCRPPENRPPQEDEIAACQPFLIQQISAIGPKIICALGTFSAQTLLSTKVRISDLRGRFHPLPGDPKQAIKVMPTFHPAYLLRSPGEKKNAWEDLQKIMLSLKEKGQ